MKQAAHHQRQDCCADGTGAKETHRFVFNRPARRFENSLDGEHDGAAYDGVASRNRRHVPAAGAAAAATERA